MRAGRSGENHGVAGTKAVTVIIHIRGDLPYGKHRHLHPVGRAPAVNELGGASQPFRLGVDGCALHGIGQRSEGCRRGVYVDGERSGNIARSGAGGKQTVGGHAHGKRAEAASARHEGIARKHRSGGGDGAVHVGVDAHLRTPQAEKRRKRGNNFGGHGSRGTGRNMAVLYFNAVSAAGVQPTAKGITGFQAGRDADGACAPEPARSAIRLCAPRGPKAECRARATPCIRPDGCRRGEPADCPETSR